MTILVINGTPHAFYNGVGLVPVRGASHRDAQALDQIVAFALFTGRNMATGPGLEVLPELPEVEEKRPIGFRL